MIHAFNPNRLHHPRMERTLPSSKFLENKSKSEDDETSVKLNSLKRKASLLLDVEHSFSGRIENDDGDSFEFQSELSFSMEYRHEMELLGYQNRQALRKRAMESFPFDTETNQPAKTQFKELGSTNDTAINQDLDKIVPDYATSDATSDRIVDFATNMLPFFMAAEEGRTLNEETLTDFEELIRGSIDTGFEQARSIIGDMELMNDPLSNLIQKTYDKVQNKFDDFLETTRKEFGGTESDEPINVEDRVEGEGATVTQFESQFRFDVEQSRSSRGEFDEKG